MNYQKVLNFWKKIRYMTMISAFCFVLFIVWLVCGVVVENNNHGLSVAMIIISVIFIIACFVINSFNALWTYSLRLPTIPKSKQTLYAILNTFSIAPCYFLLDGFLKKCHSDDEYNMLLANEAQTQQNPANSFGAPNQQVQQQDNVQNNESITKKLKGTMTSAFASIKKTMKFDNSDNQTLDANQQQYQQPTTQLDPYAQNGQNQYQQPIQSQQVAPQPAQPVQPVQASQPQQVQPMQQQPIQPQQVAPQQTQPAQPMQQQPVQPQQVMPQQAQPQQVAPQPAQPTPTTKLPPVWNGSVDTSNQAINNSSSDVNKR